MIPAEGTDRINDLIHFPQRHTVHLAVQLIEIRLYLRIIHQPQFHRASVRLPDLRSEKRWRRPLQHLHPPLRSDAGESGADP